MDSQTILKPIGLVTQPQQFGQYPSGALKVAHNWVLRNPGELQQAPGFQTQTSFATANERVEKLIPLDAGHVYALTRSGPVWSVYENAVAVALPTPLSSNSAFSDTGRISWARARDRLILNANRGYLVGDYMAPANAAERALRFCSMPQPGILAIGLTTSNAMALPADSLVGYQVIFKRVLQNGYETFGVPSPMMKVNNGPSVTNALIQVTWNASSGIVAGDYIEVYRTDAVPAATWANDPGDNPKRVLSYQLTTADAAGTSITLTDRQPMVTGTNTTPGQPLYTNGLQEGTLYGNRQPPIARCTAEFKGFVFCADTTERPQWVFSVPGGMGTQANAIAIAGLTAAAFKRFGIGERTGAGAIAIGNPNITGVSAADMVGIVQGQRWTGSSGVFAAGTTVVSAVGTTITMSTNALSVAAAFAISDVVQVNGTNIEISELARFYQQLMQQTIALYEVSCDVPIAATAGNNVFTVGAEVIIEPIRPQLSNGASFTVRATNGANYSPPVPELTATAQTFSEKRIKNRIQWTKLQEPEHWPLASEDFVGFGDVYAVNSTRDALVFWCSDGAWRLSGDAGPFGFGNWRIDPLNRTLLLVAPQASTVLGEQVWGYTNDGAGYLDPAGNFKSVSERRIGDLLPVNKYTETAAIVMEANETNREILLLTGDQVTSSDVTYVYSVDQDGWTTVGGDLYSAKVTALAMQRSPATGDPTPLFGVSPQGGLQPIYSRWNFIGTFLSPVLQYQPIYADDPMLLKQWGHCTYMFDLATATRLLNPTWNGTVVGGPVAIQALDTAGYARAAAPRSVAAQGVAVSHAVSPGFTGPGATGAAARFLGISLQFDYVATQPKKR